MSKPSPVRYRATNWSSYIASLRKRGSLLIWVDKHMPGVRRVTVDPDVQRCVPLVLSRCVMVAKFSPFLVGRTMGSTDFFRKSGSVEIVVAPRQVGA